MSGKLFPVDNSVLSAEALAARLPRLYSLSDVRSCVLFRRGVSDVYRVQARGETFYLKVYRRDMRTRRDIEDEVTLLCALGRREIPVAAPVARKNGAYLARFDAPEGARYAVLQRAAAGEPVDSSKPQDCASLGRAAARFHNACDGMRVRCRRRAIDLHYLIDEHLALVLPHMAHRGDDVAFLRSVCARVKARMTGLLPRRAPEYGLCHGDLHGGDARIDPAGRVTLFDFDSFGPGWRAIDIGVFLASLRWMDLDSDVRRWRRRAWTAFLKGYASARPVSAAEREAAELSVVARHVFLMGFVTRSAASIRGRDWLDDEFITWHMEWFRGWERSGTVL